MVQKVPTRLLTTASPDAPVDSILLNRALGALLKNHEQTAEQGDKTSLLGSDLPIQVQFSLLRVPDKPSSRPICLDIPHPLHRLIKNDHDDCDEDQVDINEDGLDDVEVCLIVKDEAKPWVLDLIQKFPSHLSYIKKVLTLTSLRKKYSQYADRRELVRRYDLFLADDRVLPMLGKTLGKSFFQQKKQPVPIKVTRKEALPFAVKRCLRGTFMWVSAGTCLSIKAGNTAMPTQKLSENIEAIVKNAALHIPRKWGNIASISVKTSSSVALPIYNKTREDLEKIAELAQVKPTEITDGKKRKFEQEERKQKEDEEIEKEKKEKLEQVAKSPLLKALKKKQKEEDEEIEKEKKQKKQKLEQVAKSPLLKALKKKQKEEDILKSTEPKSPLVKANKRKKKQASPTTEKIQLMKSANKKETTSQCKETEEEVKVASKQSAKKQKITAIGAVTPKSARKTAAKVSAKKGVDSESSEKNEFLASRKFTGSKNGYVFYKGPKGVGYYVDIKPVVNFEMVVGSNRGRSKSPMRSKSGGRSKSKSTPKSTGGKRRQSGSGRKNR